MNFDVLGYDLETLLDEDFHCNQTWMDFPFIQQKVATVSVEITITSYCQNAFMGTAVIACQY